MTSETRLGDWHLRRCTGHIETWVARPTQPVETVAATVVTILRRNGVSAFELRVIIEQVERNSVEPFFGPPYYSGVERKRRLQELISLLTERHVL